MKQHGQASVVVPSPVGPIMLSATVRGITRLQYLSDSEAADLPALSYGLDVQSTGSSILMAAAGQLAIYLAGKRRKFDLPLDLAASDDRIRVWRSLLTIPYGETRDRAWLANEVGLAPDDASLADTVAETPVPIILPNHRLKDLPAYPGGPERLAFLRQLEGM